MARKIAAILVLGFISTGLVGCAGSVSAFPMEFLPPQPEPQDQQAFLEHRGRFYALDDLMDSEVRAKSRDKFAREFEPDKMIGVTWAGQ